MGMGIGEKQPAESAGCFSYEGFDLCVWTLTVVSLLLTAILALTATLAHCGLLTTR